MYYSVADKMGFRTDVFHISTSQRYMSKTQTNQWHEYTKTALYEKYLNNITYNSGP